jgi:hypothetical protein
MSKNKGRAEGSGNAATAAKTKVERRVVAGYGRRNTDLTPDDLEMLEELKRAVNECVNELALAYERMEEKQEEFDRLKSEGRVMLADTKKIIATFQTA